MRDVLQKKQISTFQKDILSYFKNHGRSFSWRKTENPYYILVSEIMLQQTQTDRVISKYEAFLQQFPTIEVLASSPLRLVLTLWQGLGYNRRGMALHKASQIIVDKYQGKIPDCPNALQQLPGIGPYTAGAICAFAFNKPAIFIETNIRSVYLYFFFKNEIKVHDKDIMKYIEQTVYKKDPRSWYYALMDYGVMLKKKTKNINKKSIHYMTQTKFEGSDRQIRGAIIRFLTQYHTATINTIFLNIDTQEERTKKTLFNLCAEGFIQEKDGIFSIAE